jgi:hypothetical protein
VLERSGARARSNTAQINADTDTDTNTEHRTQSTEHRAQSTEHSTMNLLCAVVLLCFLADVAALLPKGYGYTGYAAAGYAGYVDGRAGTVRVQRVQRVQRAGALCMGKVDPIAFFNRPGAWDERDLSSLLNANKAWSEKMKTQNPAFFEEGGQVGRQYRQ